MTFRGDTVQLSFENYFPGSSQTQHRAAPAAPRLSTRGRRLLTIGLGPARLLCVVAFAPVLCLWGSHSRSCKSRSWGSGSHRSLGERAIPPRPFTAYTICRVVMCRLIAAGDTERFKDVTKVKQLLFAVPALIPVLRYPHPLSD